MSRAIDLLLLVLVGTAAWLLLRSDSGLEASPDGIRPINATVRVGGEAPLKDLGLLLVPADNLQVPAGTSDDVAPHQLAPFQSDRTTQILVPMAGRYRVRWGVQDDGPAPRRARDVMRELPPDAKAPDQVIEISDASIVDVIELELDPAHAEALRALVRSE